MDEIELRNRIHVFDNRLDDLLGDAYEAGLELVFKGGQFVWQERGEEQED